MVRVSGEFDFDRLVSTFKETGNISVSDLSRNDEVLIEAGGQSILMTVMSPETGEVIITSTGDWAIILHVCTFWGSTLHSQGLSMAPYRLIPGQRLCIESWVTPPMTRICINGCDLSAPDARTAN